MSLRGKLGALAATVMAGAIAFAGCSDKKKPANLVCPAPVGNAADADGDLLSDVLEAALGTNPNQADSDGDGFGDYVEWKAGTDPLDRDSAPVGAVASVRQITQASELIGGPAAQGRVGDWLLENDRIRAIVQRHDTEQMQVGGYGGNLIDADIVRAAGAPGNDELGMVVPFLSLAATSNPTQTVVINDGSDGGAAILRTCGEDATLQYIDVEAMFTALGLGLDYESNRDFSIQISNEYVLAPGSDVVEIITTIGNEGQTLQMTVGDVLESGTMQEIFSTNSQGYGEASFSSILSPQPPTRFVGTLGGAAGTPSSWGYVPASYPNVSVTISGVTVLVNGFETFFELIGSDPEGESVPGLQTIKKGGRYSYHRGVKITDGARGLGPLVDEYYLRHDEEASVHAGTVGDEDGPLKGVRISFLSTGAGNAGRNPVASVESDANGEYEVRLPAGSYYLLADLPGREFPTYSSGAPETIETVEGGNLIPAVVVALSDGSALPDITFTRGARLEVTVTEIGGASIPARVTITGTDVSPHDSVFRDGYNRGTSAVVAYDISKDGTFVFDLEPGNYTVYASRGLEWSLAEVAVSLAAGSTTTEALSIGKVVDTTGWISADFHVHMSNSPDSRTGAARRVLNGAAEGLDLIVTTDHDYITDLAPVIQAMSLSTAVAAVPGSEITPWNYGHHIAWPLTPDPERVDGGSYRWVGSGLLDNRTPRQIYEDIEAAHPGYQVKQINHPRGFAPQSYYTAVELDTLTLQTKKDAAFFRMPPVDGATEEDTGLFYPEFDAQEVLNGVDLTANIPDLNDLFTLLSHGLAVVGMGNSDTHNDFKDPLGMPRNYVQVANDAPGAMTGAAAFEELAQSVKNGRAIFTTGPFIEVTVTGADSGGPGSLVNAPGGTVQVSAELTMPDWVEVDTLRIYVNTPDTIAAAGAENAIPPVPFFESPITLTPETLGNGLSRNVALEQHNLTLPANEDAWIVVTAEAKDPGTRTLFPVMPRGTSATDGVKPYALANAVFVDVNGNGIFDPPGPAVSAAFTSPTPEPIRMYEASRGEIPAQATPDIRAQFERLLKDAHQH